MCQQISRLLRSRVSKAKAVHILICILCRCIFCSSPNFSTTFSLHRSLARGLLGEVAGYTVGTNGLRPLCNQHLYLKELVFLFLFVFPPAVLFFRRFFVFVLISVLGRSGHGTLPRLLNSERIPLTIRGNCDWELFHRSLPARNATRAYRCRRDGLKEASCQRNFNITS